MPLYRKHLIEKINIKRNILSERLKALDSRVSEEAILVSDKKQLTEALSNLKSERDKAIGKRFVENNQISDPKQIHEMRRHNFGIEQLLLAEQKKFNDSKIRLEEFKENLEILQRTAVSLHKKIDAVKREIEKVAKQKKASAIKTNTGTPSKPSSIAKTFSNPPPLIQGSKQIQFSTATNKPGFLNFFKRN